SHIDLVPTFAGLTGLPEAKRPAAVKALPGRDFSGLLVDPEKAGVHTVRPGVLFNYVGVSTVDSDYLTNVMSSLALRQPQPPVTQVKSGQARLSLLRLRWTIQVRALLRAGRFQHAADAGGNSKEQ